MSYYKKLDNWKEFMKINKKMLPLKISLALWYGGAGILIPFFNIYLIQLGISISQFSFIFTVNPILQFITPALSGIIADKIGRSKPVLVANIILCALVVNGILLVPAINRQKCFYENLEMQCHPQFSVRIFGKSSGNIGHNHHFRNYGCIAYCTNNETASYHTFSVNGTKYIPGTFSEFTLTAFGRKFKNVTWVDSKSFCAAIMRNECMSVCARSSGDSAVWKPMECPQVEDNSSVVLTACLIMSCLFAAVMSNCYRFMDVTAIFMTDTHNSDFGRERFWPILSVAIFSPLAGYLVDLTTPEGSPRNCILAIYMFDGSLVLLLIAVYYLDVQIYPPGRDMIRNVIKLAKNLDVISFSVCVLVLGTSWGFSKIFSFIYLDSMDAPSILMGLMLAVSSACGLPFLFTSNWWIQKIGSSNVLILGFLGYVFLYLGYSFMTDVWHALIYETSAIFTYHLLWVAVVRRSHEIAPKGLGATVVSSAGGIHYALGKGVGSLIGGQIMNKYGGRWAFRVIAFIGIASSILYGVFLHFRKRFTARFKESEKDDSEMLSLQQGNEILNSPTPPEFGQKKLPLQYHLPLRFCNSCESWTCMERNLENIQGEQKEVSPI